MFSKDCKLIFIGLFFFLFGLASGMIYMRQIMIARIQNERRDFARLRFDDWSRFTQQGHKYQVKSR